MGKEGFREGNVDGMNRGGLRVFVGIYTFWDLMI